MTNASVVLNGSVHIGMASSVELPSVVQKMVDHEGLGMIGVIEVSAGVEKLEGTITFNAFHDNPMLRVADPNRTHLLQLRASVETHTSEGRIDEVPYVATMNVRFKNLPAGSFTQHENTDYEVGYSATSLKIVHDQETILDYDAFSNTYKVGGVDVAQRFRQNIGQL